MPPRIVLAPCPDRCPDRPGPYPDRCPDGTACALRTFVLAAWASRAQALPHGPWGRADRWALGRGQAWTGAAVACSTPGTAV